MSQRSSKKKILLILSHTGAGGDTQVLFNLLSALAASSLEFHILSHQRGAKHESFRQFGVLYTFPLDETSWLRRLLRRFFMPIFVSLKKVYCQFLIKRINPAAIYINTINEHEFSLAAVHSGRKLVVHIHEMGFVVTQRMRSEWVDLLLHKADVIISPAQAALKFYSTVYGVDENKMTIVHETVHDSHVRPSQLTKNTLLKEGIEADTLLIGGAGSLIYRKGIDTFIQACALLKGKVPHQPFQFLWLGGQPGASQNHPYYRALLKTIEREGLSSYFQFLPYTSEVNDFYSQLDIFVLPSRMEAFPLVVLEAFLVEKPVVAMDVAGVREVVDAETGYLVKDRTPEGLAEGILYFLESEERRREAGRKGRQRVLENFEAQVQVKKWFDILNQL
ncbi:glycosyltransferase family 4 protein [Rhabdobacter roseus]|uniref:glycosyltransferase n=1 Tax=Rhabdobacter roseus TaxID=1655419 RepID=UPI0016229F1A